MGRRGNPGDCVNSLGSWRKYPRFAAGIFLPVQGQNRDQATLLPERLEDLIGDDEAFNQSLTIDTEIVATPAAGTFQIGTLIIPSSNLAATSQLIPAKDESGTSYRFLWRASDRQLWFDTNRDHLFLDEVPIQPFAMSGEFVVLGTDDPSTLARESVALVYQLAGKDSLVFDLTADPHAS